MPLKSPFLSFPLSPFLPLSLSLTLLAGCASDDRTNLIIYSPHGKEMLTYYEEAFETAYPEVDVRWIDMGGQDAYDRIRTERQRPQASLWWGGAAPTFDRAAEEGLLASYTPSWAEAVPDEAHDPQNRWYGTYLTPEVVAYNSRLLSEEEAPADWDALLDPEWQDRLLIRDPLASATMRTIFGAMILRQPTVEEGYRWLARLDQNTKAYTADPTQLYLRLAREEGALTLWNMPDIYLQRAVNDFPFGYLFPESGTPVLTDAIALVADAPQPEIAKDFYEFVTSDSALVHQAEAFYRIPVRDDLDQAQLPDWITNADIKEMQLDWNRLMEEGATWMQFWSENIKGRGAEYLEENG